MHEKGGFDRKGKRLTVLISDCDDFLGKIGRTRSKMTGVKKFEVRRRILKKRLEKIDDQDFDEKIRGCSKKFDREVDVEKVNVVRSLLKKDKMLKRKKELQGKEDWGFQVVEYGTLQNDEVKELLKCNRRHFGNHFSEDIKIPEKCPKITPLSTKPTLKVIKPIKKIPMNSILKEKRQLSQLLKIEKILHETLPR